MDNKIYCEEYANGTFKVGISPETAEPLGDKVDFLKEKMPEVPTELRDCSRELEYIKDMIKENEAEHDRLEERRHELELIQAKYNELEHINAELEKINDVIIRLNYQNSGLPVISSDDIQTIIRAAEKRVLELCRKRDELKGRFQFVIPVKAKKEVLDTKKALEIFGKIADENNRAKFIINIDKPPKNEVPPLCAQGSIAQDEFILNEEQLATLASDSLYKAAEKLHDDLLNHQTIPLSEKEEYREKLEEALSAVNLIQDALDPSRFSDGSLSKISNFLQDARDYIVDALDEFKEVNCDD